MLFDPAVNLFLCRRMIAVAQEGFERSGIALVYLAYVVSNCADHVLTVILRLETVYLSPANLRETV